MQLTTTPYSTPIAFPAEIPPPPSSLVAFRFECPALDVARAVCGARGWTGAAPLFSSLAGLLSCYTGQEEFQIGAAANGNALMPVDVRVGDDLTFASGCDLFNNPATGEICFHVSAELQRFWVRECDNSSHGALVLRIVFHDRIWDGTLDYTHTPLSAEGAERFVNHFQRLFELGLQSPDAPFSTLEFIGAAERKRILSLGAGPSHGYPGPNLHELFERQVARTPEASALRFHGQRWTYAELNRWSNRMARHFRALGVLPGAYVGMALDRSLEGVAAILGILKCGGAYVPLDPTYPLLRLKEMADDSGVLLIVTSAALKDRVPPGNAKVVVLDQAVREIERLPDTNLNEEVGLDAHAFITYTSGSTDRPKAVIGTHRAIINGLNNPPFDTDLPGEISCLNCSLSFSLSLARIFLPLLCGVELVLFDDADSKDLARFARVIEKEGVTNVLIVTSALEQLLRLPDVSRMLGKLRTVVSGGAHVGVDLLAQFDRLLPDTKLINGLGASEVGGAAIIDFVHHSNEMTRRSVGRPFSNTIVYILGKQQELLPEDVPGELYIGAPHISPGYLNHPELTAQRFLPDPFTGGRMYRTGDLARFLPSGQVQLLGRIDNMVKVRGYRIELEEIDAALKRHPGLEDAAAGVWKNGGDPQLVGYFVPRAGRQVAIEELRSFIGERLPRYMVPNLFVKLEALPMTGTGKLQRSALPEPTPARPDLQAEFAAPRNETESAIARLFAESLGLKSLSIHDEFLNLGGDSLKATEVISGIWEEFQIEVPLRVLFEGSTVASLAAVLAGLEPGADPFGLLQQASAQ